MRTCVAVSLNSLILLVLTQNLRDLYYLKLCLMISQLKPNWSCSKFIPSKGLAKPPQLSEDSGQGQHSSLSPCVLPRGFSYPSMRFVMGEPCALILWSWSREIGKGKVGKRNLLSRTFSAHQYQESMLRNVGMEIDLPSLCLCTLYILWQLSCTWRSVPTRICCVSNQFCGFIIKAEIFLPVVCVCVCLGMHVHTCVSFRTADQGKSFLLFRVLSQVLFASMHGLISCLSLNLHNPYSP